MWTVRHPDKTILCVSRDFKLCYRIAKFYRGTLTYKP